jgi:hypothetical protein
MSTSRRPALSSGLWIAYFAKNERMVTSDDFKPPATREMPADVRAALAGSLPSWQLGASADGRRLRAVARRHAEAVGDPRFPEVVDYFIREEQRRGAALGDWLDRVGFPRRRWDAGDTILRFWRHAIPTCAAWATVVVMVKLLAEIYYASVRSITPSLRLQAECDRILRDEARHIQFLCELIAASRRGWPSVARSAMRIAEAIFFAAMCLGVFLVHGKPMRLTGVTLRKFAAAAAGKLRFLRETCDPGRYSFPESRDAVADPQRRELGFRGN